MGSSVELASPSASPLMASPFSSPSPGFLLSRRILAWSQETGSSPSVHVSVGGKTFDVHKSPLVFKCGYFKKALVTDSPDVDLHDDFPGGPETFEKIALFVYGSPTPFDPFTVAATRCAAEFLEMTEDHAPGNLCERSDLYLNQVVLQSWDDTLIVLQRCQPLLPWSEQLLIVSRCVESLAFMACMEILDPEQRRDRPAATLQAMVGRPWSCDAAREIAGQDLWVKDLIALPFPFFKRIVGSLRRQGMKEKYVSPLVVFYANEWVVSGKTHQFWRHSGEQGAPGRVNNNKVSSILEGVIELLPVGEKARRVIPVGFYFALLSRGLGLGVGEDGRRKLQKQIAAVLDTAQVGDFLLPEASEGSMASSVEVLAMERIFSIYASSNRGSGSSEGTPTPSSRNPAVAELWDCYLSQIAVDPEMCPGRFMALVEAVPISDRETHDHLYNALNTFLLNHPDLSSKEKASVCKYLDCGKLSEETCIRAVQNELMPLRLIVQALFVQQLNTHQVFKDCSGSFRCAHPGDLSGSLPSSRFQLCKTHEALRESPFRQASDGEEEEEAEAGGGAPLGFLMGRDVTAQRAKRAKAEYESTSFRIQTLEQELRSLRRSLQGEDDTSKGSCRIATEHRVGRVERSKTAATKTKKRKKKKKKKKKKKSQVGQAGNCMASVSWASQRKCARRLLKILRRIAMWGGGSSKRRQAAASGPSDGSISCRSNHLNELYDW